MKLSNNKKKDIQKDAYKNFLWGFAYIDLESISSMEKGRRELYWRKKKGLQLFNTLSSLLILQVLKYLAKRWKRKIPFQ